MNPGICNGCRKQVEHRVWIEERIDPEDNIGHFQLELCEACTDIYIKNYDREGLDGVWKRCRENQNVQD